MTTSAALAHSITWRSSKQSYFTALLLADRVLVDDCLRAYAYFRWADDAIDIALQSEKERAAFITRQKMLIEKLYRMERITDLCPEEQMLVDLIGHDRSPDSGLHSFICNFMAVIEFDSNRMGRLVSSDELTTYTNHLATAVMDGLQYFIGNGHPYPKTPERAMAVSGAHITHMLRDMLEDLPSGIINIPLEAITEYGISMEELDNQSFRQWVYGQTKKARQDFLAGQGYINSISVLRCKLAGVWYLARFDCILNAIEQEGYRLQVDYPERHSLATWMEIVRLSIKVTVEHIASRLRRILRMLHRPIALPSAARLHSYPSNK